MSGYQNLEENLNELLNDLNRLQEEEEQKNKQVEELRAKLGEALQLIDAAGTYTIDQRLSTLDGDQIANVAGNEALQAELKAKDQQIQELTAQIEEFKQKAGQVADQEVGNAKNNDNKENNENNEKKLQERIEDQEGQLAWSDELRQALAQKLQRQIATNDDLLDEIDRLQKENEALKAEIATLKGESQVEPTTDPTHVVQPQNE